MRSLSSEKTVNAATEKATVCETEHAVERAIEDPMLDEIWDATGHIAWVNGYAVATAIRDGSLW